MEIVLHFLKDHWINILAFVIFVYFLVCGNTKDFDERFKFDDE